MTWRYRSVPENIGSLAIGAGEPRCGECKKVFRPETQLLLMRGRPPEYILPPREELARIADTVCTCGLMLVDS